MQVATLFRESATLLGAAMEPQENTDSQGMKYTSVKPEPLDDGYETAADLERLPPHRLVHHPMLHEPQPINLTLGRLKMEQQPDDPYSFVDEEFHSIHTHLSPPQIIPVPKKRGRKKKMPMEDGQMGCVDIKKKKKKGEEDGVVKERRKHDRFNGMSEEEVSRRTLPDHIAHSLDVLIIGINPGLFAAYKGHHYAGPGNHFWKCLFLSGLIPEPMTADDDFRLLHHGIGFTNMVSRATKGSADLTRREIKEGSQVLLEKLQKYQPKIAVFNGKLIFEVFSGRKDFPFGRQPEFVDGTNTYIWVMPSSSARCAQLPRAADKVPFYAALKKFRDFLIGVGPPVDDSELVFTEAKLKHFLSVSENERQAAAAAEAKEEQANNYYDYANGEGGEDCKGDYPVKKKRGRPKKVKCEDDRRPSEQKHSKHDVNGEKKKRGRPKKGRGEDDVSPEMQLGEQHNMQHSTCFSPSAVPQSPYQSSPYHPYPIHTQQVHTPPQQPAFTHSDLSSEISAAISSEHNLVSPPATSPSLGPPDFDPPASMPEDVQPEGRPNSVHNDNTQQESTKESVDQDGFSTPPSSSTDSQIGSQSYTNSGYQYPVDRQETPMGNYQSSSETEFEGNKSHPPTSMTGHPPTSIQDVTTKSLSGLESLVDQIPSIADGGEHQHPGGNTFTTDTQHTPAFTEGYMGGGYANGSPHYSGNGGGFSPHYPSSYGQQQQTPSSSFSVSSLTSTDSPSFGYNYANFPPPPNLYNMTPCTTSLPYPYSQYPVGGASYPSGGGFPYSPASHHPLHLTSPNYAYPSPYSNSAYSQAPYNHVLDRIKQERMDLGFGSF